MDKKRLILTVQSVLCAALAVVLCVIIVGIYHDGIAAKAQYPDAWIYTREIVAGRLLPVGILFLCAAAAAVWAHFAGVRGTEAGRPSAPAGRVVNRAESPRTVILRRALLAAAILMILAGIRNGSMQDVLYKAVRICTECVGLG